MNRHHADVPSRLAPEDFALQRIAVRTGDIMRARAAMWDRLARFAVCSMAAVTPLVLFYSIGSY